MQERKLTQLVRELCFEEDIHFELLSYGWIMQLQKGDKIRHIAGSRFDLNPEATGNIACDKYGTYCVLKSRDVPIIEHKIIFSPTARRNYISDDGIWLEIASYFLKHKKVVVKPNNGNEGQGVFLCSTFKDVEYAVEKLFKTNGSLSICPYYDIKTEYRTFYISGKVDMIYGKTKPYVIGDGVSSLGYLVENLGLPDKSVVKDNLKNLDLSYIPLKDEKVEISWKHNLSGGATPTILEPGELYDKITELAVEAGKAMNINIATIDVIQTVDDELYIMEINSGICTTIFIDSVEDGFAIAKEVYRHALKEMFKD